MAGTSPAMTAGTCMRIKDTINYQNTGEHVFSGATARELSQLEGAEQHCTDEHEHRAHGDDVPFQG
jgi:hypothetical protein